MFRKILCALGIHWHIRTGRVEVLYVDESPEPPHDVVKEKYVCKFCGDIDWRKPKC